MRINYFILLVVIEQNIFFVFQTFFLTAVLKTKLSNKFVAHTYIYIFVNSVLHHLIRFEPTDYSGFLSDFPKSNSHEIDSFK